MKIDKLLSGEFTTATSFGGSDQIWRWDTTVNKWAKYSYSKLTRQGAPAWRKFNYGTDESFSDLTDEDAVKPGETFMFFRAGDEPVTVTLSGQVRAFGSPTGYTVAKENYVFMAYPWPVEVKIADLPNLGNWETLTTATSFGGSDQVWRWDTTVNKWAKYSYSKLTRQGAPAWRKFNYATDESFSDLTDADKLLAGEGFLFFRAGDDPITITWKSLESAE